MRELHRRSVVKAVSWRVIATVSTVAIIYAFTGAASLSLKVGLVEIVTKFLLYYAHERTWGAIRWGKQHHPLSALPVSGELTPDDMEKVRDVLRDMGYL